MTTYTDIDFNLEINNATKDVLKVNDMNAIKASVKHLVLTEFYGRPFHPEIGSAVAGLLFENWTPLTEQAIKMTVIAAIENYEPRVEITRIIATYNDSNNSVECTVEFYAKALMQEATIDILLSRAR